MIAPQYISTAASLPGAEIDRELMSMLAARFTQSAASNSDRSILMSALMSLYVECSQANWDGEGSLPVGRLTLGIAQQFVRDLPLDVPTPDVSCAADGSIEFDWIPMRGKALGVGVHASDRLSVAWLDGNDRGHAVLRYTAGELPTRLNQLIRSIAGSKHA